VTATLAAPRPMDWYYRLSYLLGRAPWDTGVPPPELVEVVEGPRALRPGRALDLGCGSGTNSVYLARWGWEVTGVELVGRAVERARRRARASGVAPRLLKGDVARLAELGLEPGFGLLFDLGCHHSLDGRRRDAYAAAATRLAAPGALLLLYGFAPGAWSLGPLRNGVTAAELRTRFRGWELIEERRGGGRFAASWYTLRRLARRRRAAELELRR
jgi:SAM-dependent methyltransferase